VTSINRPVLRPACSAPHKGGTGSASPNFGPLRRGRTGLHGGPDMSCSPAQASPCGMAKGTRPSSEAVGRRPGLTSIVNCGHHRRGLPESSRRTSASVTAELPASERAGNPDTMPGVNRRGWLSAPARRPIPRGRHDRDCRGRSRPTRHLISPQQTEHALFYRHHDPHRWVASARRSKSPPEAPRNLGMFLKAGEYTPMNFRRVRPRAPPIRRQSLESVVAGRWAR